MNLRTPRIIVPLALLVGLMYCAYQFGWLAQLTRKKVDQLVHITCADLSQGCSFKLNAESYHLKSAAAVTSSKPVQLELIGKAEKIYLTWEMQGMEMASPRYRMLRSPDHQWRAETALAICSQKRQDWLLTVDIDQSQVVIQTQSAG